MNEKIEAIKCISEKHGGPKIIVRVGYGPKTNTIIITSLQIDNMEIDLRKVRLFIVEPETHSLIISA